MRILVAEDDAPLADFLRQRLVQEQFAVHLASDGTEAQHLAANQAFDLVILDLNLPGTGGLDVGADDYVAKPFAFAELAARIRAVLRRGNRPSNAILTVADLALDRVDHTVRRNGHNIELSPKEFALLEFLMRHAGQAVTRTAIVEQVWKLNFDTMTNVVDVYINYLRRKVDTGYDHALIRTVRGVGYQIGGNGANA